MRDDSAVSLAVDAGSAASIDDAVREQEARRFAADWAFAFAQTEQGAFRDLGGRFVAIFQREVVAVGDSETELRQSFARSGRGTGEQLVVFWIEDDDVR